MSADRLRDELGTTDLPETVADLPAADLALLADLLAGARHEQAQALTEATARGLGFLPRLLRGPVQKVLLR